MNLSTISGEIIEGIDQYYQEKIKRGDLGTGEIIDPNYEKMAVTNDLKEKYPFLISFMDNPDKKNRDFNQSIMFVDELPYKEDMLNETGTITMHEYEAFGDRYFVIGKDNDIQLVPFNIVDDEGFNIERAYKNLGNYINEDTKYVIYNLYSSDANQNKAYIVKYNKKD